MNSIMTIGTSALNSAAGLASRAANQVVQSQPNLEEPVPEAPRAAPLNLRPPFAPNRDQDAMDLVSGTVDLLRAEHAYKASAAILRTGDAMMKESLRLV